MEPAGTINIKFDLDLLFAMENFPPDGQLKVTLQLQIDRVGFTDLNAQSSTRHSGARAKRGNPAGDFAGKAMNTDRDYGFRVRRYAAPRNDQPI